MRYLKKGRRVGRKKEIYRIDIIFDSDYCSIIIKIQQQTSCLKVLKSNKLVTRFPNKCYFRHCQFCIKCPSVWCTSKVKCDFFFHGCLSGSRFELTIREKKSRFRKPTVVPVPWKFTWKCRLRILGVSAKMTRWVRSSQAAHSDPPT